MLTVERLRELLTYDPETGIFRWVKTPKGWKHSDNVAGAKHNQGYRRIRIDQGDYLSHHLAWLYVTGEWPAEDVDHVNGTRGDDRFCNLREASRAENHQNRAIDVKNTSGFPGVSFRKDRGTWRSQITVKGKRKILGCFPTPEQAYAAYEKAKAQLHSFHPVVRDFECERKS